MKKEDGKCLARKGMLFYWAVNGKKCLSLSPRCMSIIQRNNREFGTTKKTQTGVE